MRLAFLIVANAVFLGGISLAANSCSISRTNQLMLSQSQCNGNNINIDCNDCQARGQTVVIEQSSWTVCQTASLATVTQFQLMNCKGDNVKWVTIKDFAFRDFSALVFLQLHDNRISIITANAFAKLKTVTQVLLDLNPIALIENGAFNEFTSAQQFADLKGAVFTTLPFDIISKLAKVRSRITMPVSLTCRINDPYDVVQYQQPGPILSCPGAMTPNPTPWPTPLRTPSPISLPTRSPTENPKQSLSPAPTRSPTPRPSQFPTPNPTLSPTSVPSPQPIQAPSMRPTPISTSPSAPSPTTEPSAEALTSTSTAPPETSAPSSMATLPLSSTKITSTPRLTSTSTAPQAGSAPSSMSPSSTLPPSSTTEPSTQALSSTSTATPATTAPSSMSPSSTLSPSKMSTTLPPPTFKLSERRTPAQSASVSTLKSTSTPTSSLTTTIISTTTTLLEPPETLQTTLWGLSTAAPTSSIERNGTRICSPDAYHDSSGSCMTYPAMTGEQTVGWGQASTSVSAISAIVVVTTSTASASGGLFGMASSVGTVSHPALSLWIIVDYVQHWSLRSCMSINNPPFARDVLGMQGWMSGFILPMPDRVADSLKALTSRVSHQLRGADHIVALSDSFPLNWVTNTFMIPSVDLILFVSIANFGALLLIVVMSLILVTTSSLIERYSRNPPIYALALGAHHMWDWMLRLELFLYQPLLIMSALHLAYSTDEHWSITLWCCIIVIGLTIGLNVIIYLVVRSTSEWNSLTVDYNSDNRKFIITKQIVKAIDIAIIVLLVSRPLMQVIGSLTCRFTFALYYTSRDPMKTLLDKKLAAVTTWAKCINVILLIALAPQCHLSADNVMKVAQVCTAINLLMILACIIARFISSIQLFIDQVRRGFDKLGDLPDTPKLSSLGHDPLIMRALDDNHYSTGFNIDPDYQQTYFTSTTDTLMAPISPKHRTQASRSHSQTTLHSGSQSVNNRSMKQYTQK